MGHCNSSLNAINPETIFTYCPVNQTEFNNLTTLTPLFSVSSDSTRQLKSQSDNRKSIESNQKQDEEYNRKSIESNNTTDIF
jgi:hypothetical protein